MTDTSQHALWNGPAGEAWVEAQRILDQMFAPLATHLLEAIPPGDDLHVLDVGCGTGAVALAIAGQLGPQGHVTGVDISAPMIALARERAQRAGLAVDFIVADAQQHVFAAGSLDRIVSRFGVMFFDDPVQAFGQLQRAARRGGVLHVLAWRGPDQNPFMTTAERAAAPWLALPPRQPEAPGQFAFADRARVERILKDSGWEDIEVLPLDVICRIDRADLATYVALLGPVGSALRGTDLDGATRTQVLEAVMAAFAPFIEGDAVTFTAACWEVRARAW
ncbi:ubiquinone/menaquinone biosynthesis C-methylase UbiE [Stenotrophomonas rhizophila]|uniref:class I SAM-dependent methyltransferase n=1 Tax=Stenotrophomonas rhizophila TaxID=216778 RepID=UPI000F4B15EF|nr:class I SAM-dependent methyltransferase [Stenotrophomonas rhizophila]ROP80369.1 ubiquinone/menaquinone biosynthesis C-methylase UbiE [Stenotrophomonas rhizophila]